CRARAARASLAGGWAPPAAQGRGEHRTIPSRPTTTTATLLPGEFTSGDLADFVGLPVGSHNTSAQNTSPANQIGGFGAGGVTSYSVYQVNLGSQTLTANGATCQAGGPGPGVVSGCSPLMTVSS